MKYSFKETKISHKEKGIRIIKKIENVKNNSFFNNFKFILKKLTSYKLYSKLKQRNCLKM